MIVSDRSFTLVPLSNGDVDSSTRLDIGSGFLRFTHTRYKTSTAGLMDITIERYGGTSGALSATVTQSDCNRSSGKYTSSPIYISFADGEIGIKTYQFNVSTAPTDGPYWINLQLNIGQSLARHWWDNNSTIEVYDNVNAPSIDMTNVYEVGPTGDYTTILDAAIGVTAPAVVLIREGTYSDEHDNGSTRGIRPRHTGSYSDRIIFMSYPAEIVTVDCDSSITDMTLQVPNNNGFYFQEALAGNSPINGWIIKDLTIKHAGIGFYLDSSSIGMKYNIIEDCIIEDCGGSEGTNPAGVRFDNQSQYSAVRNCIIRRIYEGMSLHLDTSDNNACVHGYRGSDVSIEDNTLCDSSALIYHKEPFIIDSRHQSGYIVRRNNLGDCHVGMKVQNAWKGWDDTVPNTAPLTYSNIDVYHNIAAKFFMLPDVAKTFFSAKSLWMYGNNFGEGSGNISHFESAEYYNNATVLAGAENFGFVKVDNWVRPKDNIPSNPLYQDPYDPSSWNIPNNEQSTNIQECGDIEYIDNNTYYPAFSATIGLNGSTPMTYTGLPEWRLATDPDILPIAGADKNSQILDPMFDIDGRATVVMPIGRFGQVVGVPDYVTVGDTLK